MTDTTPGWQPDPTGKHDHRYWDGTQWTENVSDSGVAAIDPYVPEAPQVPEAAEPPAPVEVEPTMADAEPDATAAWPTSG
ncbi:MAG: DUF2510 domain-containing protein, partial [Acidimicrobiales bacterium]